MCGTEIFHERPFWHSLEAEDVFHPGATHVSPPPESAPPRARLALHSFPSLASSLLQHYLIMSSSAAQTFAILGATGQVGGRAARQLLASGHHVRAVVRDTTSTASQELKSLGAELFEVKVNDPSPFGTDTALLTTAFTGVDGAFILIPPHLNIADINKEAAAFVEKVKQAVIASKIKKLVFLSSVAAHLTSGAGPIDKLHRMEQAFNAILKSADIAVTYVRAGYFFSNIVGSLAAVPHGILPGPIQDPETKICAVSTDDIGDLVAKSLLDKSVKTGSSQAIELSGPEELSNNQIVQIISDIVGKPIVYAPMQKDERATIFQGFGFSAEGASQFLLLADGLDNGTITFENAATVVRGKVHFKDFLTAQLKK